MKWINQGCFTNFILTGIISTFGKFSNLLHYKTRIEIVAIIIIMLLYLIRLISDLFY